MKLQFVSSAASSRRSMCRSLHVRLLALALAVLFTATQMPAESALTATPQAAAQQSASAGQNASQTAQGNATVRSAAAPDSAKSATVTASTLPDAPVVPAATSESASLNMPADMKAMMDDAAQAGENLQSTPKSSNKKLVQRPGMLVMGIAGVPLMVLGVMVLSLKVGPKEAGARDGLGAAFLAPGAAMSGLGFYFAFHKKSN